LAQVDAFSTTVGSCMDVLEKARSAYHRCVAWLDERQKIIQRDEHSNKTLLEELRGRSAALTAKERTLQQQAKDNASIRQSTAAVKLKYEDSLRVIGALETRIQSLETERSKLTERVELLEAAANASAAASSAGPKTEAHADDDEASDSYDSDSCDEDGESEAPEAAAPLPEGPANAGA
jgi:chromosome segregation ATPase